MAFSPIQKLLDNWFKTKKFEGSLQKKQVIDLVDKYIQEHKNWPSDIARASFFDKGNLTIKCQQSAVASELHMEELSLRKYIQESLPEVKIKKIFYNL